MILCFDLGNTRWKWALYGERQLKGHGAWIKTDLASVDSKQNHNLTGTNRLARVSLIQSMLSELQKNNQCQIQEVLVSSVAEQDAQDAIAEACQLELAVNAHFAKVHVQCAGITAAYKHPDNLGVDRWLALIAAWSKYRENCVVLDAGSALTADYISIDGEHSGGLIAPGLRMMEKALFEKTAKVKPENLSIPVQWSPQSDTMPCVEHGLAAMLAGFVVQIEQKYAGFKLIITGGDAELAAHYVVGDCVVEPFLVFEGLLYYRDAFLEKK